MMRRIPSSVTRVASVSMPSLTYLSKGSLVLLWTPSNLRRTDKRCSFVKGLNMENQSEHGESVLVIAGANVVWVGGVKDWSGWMR